MAEKRTTSSGSEGGRSRAAEFAAKPDANKTQAKAESAEADASASANAKPDAAEGKPTETGEAPATETYGATATNDSSEPASAATRDASAGKPARGEATEVPVKIAAAPESSEYLVTIDNKTGRVTRIERFNASNADRQPLSPAGIASVSAQLGTATNSYSATLGGGDVPAMLNAPAFNSLVARSAANSPALSELTRNAVAFGLTVSNDKRASAPPPAGKGSAPGSTAMLQAYYQGALDYLNALATGAVNGR